MNMQRVWPMMESLIVVHVITNRSSVQKLGLGSFLPSEVRGKTYAEDTHPPGRAQPAGRRRAEHSCPAARRRVHRPGAHGGATHVVASDQYRAEQRARVPVGAR